MKLMISKEKADRIRILVEEAEKQGVGEDPLIKEARATLQEYDMAASIKENMGGSGVKGVQWVEEDGTIAHELNFEDI